MNKTLKIVWNVISTIIVVLVVLLAVALVGVRLFGVQTYAVVSGSMEPMYSVGSLLYVKSVDPNDLKVDDPITFMLDEDTVATHRIIEILPDEENDVLRFRTKGDANKDADGTPVHQNNIIGKPMFAVPYLGYFASFIQNPPGLYLAICAAAVLIILVFIPDLLKDDKNKKDKKDKKDKADTPAAPVEETEQTYSSDNDKMSNSEMPSDADGVVTPPENGDNS